MNPVLCVCLSATFQYTIVFSELRINEVNRTEMHYLDPSGKGINVARILKKEGIDSRVVTHLGGVRKEEFLSLCSRDGISLFYAETDAPIRTSTTLVDLTTHTSTELLEETGKVSAELASPVHELVRENLEDCSALVISGSRPLGYPEDIYSRMAEEAERCGKRVILDMKGKDLVACLRYRPEIIKPNLQEFAETFLSLSVLENEPNEELFPQVREKAEEIYRKYNTKTVITRGEYDSWVFDGKTLEKIKNEENVSAVNTIGCGDVLTACMLSELLRGNDIISAVAYGMKRASERAQRIRLL